jgi:hypothetical protein
MAPAPFKGGDPVWERRQRVVQTGLAAISCSAGRAMTILTAGPATTSSMAGRGNNWFIGNAGNDTFVVTPQVISGQAKPDQEAGQNFVENFTTGQDHIDLTAFHTTLANVTAQQHPGPRVNPLLLRRKVTIRFLLSKQMRAFGFMTFCSEASLRDG